jgi:hypothetical protein
MAKALSPPPFFEQASQSERRIMFNFEIEPAAQRLADAIQFRQKGGYWFPDLTVDRNAITLAKIRYKPSKSEDEVLAQFANVAFVQFNEPPLGQPRKPPMISSPSDAALAVM